MNKKFFDPQTGKEINAHEAEQKGIEGIYPELPGEFKVNIMPTGVEIALTREGYFALEYLDKDSAAYTVNRTLYNKYYINIIFLCTDGRNPDASLRHERFHKIFDLFHTNSPQISANHPVTTIDTDGIIADIIQNYSTRTINELGAYHMGGIAIENTNFRDLIGYNYQASYEQLMEVVMNRSSSLNYKFTPIESEKSSVSLVQHAYYEAAYNTKLLRNVCNLIKNKRNDLIFILLLNSPHLLIIRKNSYIRLLMVIIKKLKIMHKKNLRNLSKY